MKLAAEDSAMARSEARVFRAVAVGAVAIGAAAGRASAQAVEWRVEDGGNGHWYRVTVFGNEGMNWTDARAALREEGADLASLESVGERAFVLQLVNLGQLAPWIGLFQDPLGCEPGCGWQWVSGLPLTDSDWSTGEPNNMGGPYGDEDHAPVMGKGWGGTGKWADWPGSTSLKSASALTEWSADCDANGLVDFGEIVRGEKSDSDGDNVPDCCEAGIACACTGDVDENALVDAIDLAIVLERWGAVPKDYPRADVNGDGTVDGADLSAVLFAWGACGG